MKGFYKNDIAMFIGFKDLNRIHNSNHLFVLYKGQEIVWDIRCIEKI